MLGKVWSIFKWKIIQFTLPTVTFSTKQGTMTVSTRDDVIAKLLYLNREYQLDTTRQVLEFLHSQGKLPTRGTGTLLDIGANIGIISIGMLTRGEIATAIGIEPDPTNFELCQLNARQNGLSDRFNVLQLAASGQPGTLHLARSRNNFGDHHVSQSATGDTVSVKAEPIDSILANLNASVNLVWIDVQGYEGYVLQGGAKLFSSGVPVVCEIWPFGIQRAGMTVTQFCEIAAAYWKQFWVWEPPGQYAVHPIGDLAVLCSELERKNTFDDIILM